MAEQKQDLTEKTSDIPKYLSLLGVFSITVLTPVGLLYTLHGNLILTGVISLSILASLMLLSTYLTKNKNRQNDLFGKVNDNRTNSRTSEYILLVAYIAVAFVIFPFMFHYIDVDFSRKKELTNAGYEKLNTIRDLKRAYNKEIDKKADRLETKVDAFVNSYFTETKANRPSVYKDSIENILGEGVIGFKKYERNINNTDAKEKIIEQVKNEKTEKKIKIKLDYKLGHLDKDTKKFYDDGVNVFKNWKKTKVSLIYYRVDNEYEKLYDAMKEKMPGFEYAIVNIPDIKLDSPVKSLFSASVIKILLIVLLAIILHILVLAEYIAAKRVSAAIIRQNLDRGEEEDSLFKKQE